MIFSQHNLKKLIFLVFLAGLFLCLVQWKVKLFEEKPLKGAIEVIKEPQFSKQEWLEGKFQERFDTWFENNIGFRPFFVRFNNQLRFSLFNLARAKGVVKGREGYLFEENYIRSYTGRDFITKDSIDYQLWKLRFLQDRLKSKGIDLFVVFAPGKASFYSEFIPQVYQPEKRSITNYDYYATRSKALKINHIDFNKWFLATKDSSRYPLYPKGGIHWSMYGVTLAADSIARYVSQLHQIELPRLIIDSILKPGDLRETDGDIEEGMNLLFPLDHLQMAYPHTHWEKDPIAIQPPLLTISDSYFWNMTNTGISTECFQWGSFWFYFKEMYPETWNAGKSVFIDDRDLKTEIEKNKIIMLMSTDANLFRFPYGFIDKAFDVYLTEFINEEFEKFSVDSTYHLPGGLLKPDLKMFFYQNPVLFEDISRRADSLGLPVDTVISREVFMMVERRAEEIQAFENRVKELTAKIRSDEKWMISIAKKAAERGISEAEMIRKDAEWIAKNELKKQN